MQQTARSEKHGHKGMSQFELTKLCINNLSQYDITPCAKLVFLYLSTCYNPKRHEVFPKQSTIAKTLGVSERSVIRAVQELIKAGVVYVECKHTNRYSFSQKVTCCAWENDNLSTSDKMSDDECQNVIPINDKLSGPIHEQKKNSFSNEELEKLFSFAVQRGAKNPEAYVHTMVLNGSANELLNQLKSSKKALEETTKMLQMQREHAQQCKRPEEFTLEEARKFVDNMPEMLRERSTTVKMLCERWGL